MGAEPEAPPEKLGQAVCPGDLMLRLPETGVVRIGGGVQQEGGALVALRAGTLQQARNGKLWVETRQKRYVPSLDELVIGRVAERHGETYDVDIGGAFKATLPLLAFEGATRRNRPNLQVGDLVYCRVDGASRDMEPSLSCMDGAGRSAGLGPLAGGRSLEVSSTHARALLSRPPAPILAALGGSLQYEIAVGQNGRVWVSAPATHTAILVCNAIKSSEFLSAAQCQQLVAALLRGGGRQAGGQQQQQQQGAQPG